jgi:hypothetical protein
VFCESVQHRMRFCLLQLSCHKIPDFQFDLQSGELRKVRQCGGTIEMLFLVKKNSLVKMQV